MKKKKKDQKRSESSRSKYQIIFVVLIIFLGLLLLFSFKIFFTGKIVGVDTGASIRRRIVVIQDFPEGDSTDFLQYGDDELESIENLTIEKSEFGKIVFNEIINFSLDVTETNNLINLTAFVNVSNNRIEIITTNLTSLNKSAQIFFYNVSLTNPSVNRDGESCPSTDCTILSNTNNIITVNVSHFTVYSLSGESVSPPSTPTISPSVDSGGRSPYSQSIITVELKPVEGIINVEQDIIKVQVQRGGTRQGIVWLQNNGNDTIEVILKLEGSSELITILEHSIILGPGERKSISFEVNIPSGQNIGIYTAKILFEGTNEEISLIIEVLPQTTDLDVEVKILNQPVSPGELVQTEINLVSRVGTKLEGVKLTYGLMNFEGKTLVSNEEIIDIDEFLRLIRSLEIPDNLEKGKYLFFVNVEDDGIIALASEVLEVGETKESTLVSGIIIVSFIIIMTVLMVFVVILSVKYLRNLKRKKVNLSLEHRFQ